MGREGGWGGRGKCDWELAQESQESGGRQEEGGQGGRVQEGGGEEEAEEEQGEAVDGCRWDGAATPARAHGAPPPAAQARQVLPRLLLNVDIIQYSTIQYNIVQC